VGLAPPVNYGDALTDAAQTREEVEKFAQREPDARACDGDRGHSASDDDMIT
jgi:hypothetical protein